MVNQKGLDLIFLIQALEHVLEVLLVDSYVILPFDMNISEELASVLFSPLLEANCDIIIYVDRSCLDHRS